MAAEYESLYTPTATCIPWEGRCLEQWPLAVSKEEAIYLFDLASRTSTLNNPNWIKEYHLQTPFEAYWQKDYTQLITALKKQEKIHPGGIETASLEYTQRIMEIFQNPNLYKYFFEAKKLSYKKNEKKTEEENNSLNINGFYQKIACNLNLTSEQVTEEFGPAYQNITELFWPSAQKMALKKANLYNEDRNEWLSIAGYELPLRVIRFYWETLPLDPEKTIYRFLGALNLGIQNSAHQGKDASSLEVSIKIEHDSTSQNLEEKILENERIEELNQLLRSNISSKLVAQIVELRLHENLSFNEIAKKLKVPSHTVLNNMERLRNKIRDNLSQDSSNTAPRETKQPRNRFWIDLLENLESYQRLYGSKKQILPAFHQRLLEKFFALAQAYDFSESTQDISEFKDQTFKKLSEDFPNIKIDTIRRHVARGINTLYNKEKPQYQNTNSHSEWIKSQEKSMCLYAKNNPDIWSSFSPKMQHAFEECGINKRARVEVAKEIGVHNTTISRWMDNLEKSLKREPSYKPLYQQI